MHSLNSVATNWQMSEGTIVSEGDRVYGSQQFNTALKTKHSFNVFMLPMADYDSAPTSIHRR